MGMLTYCKKYLEKRVDFIVSYSLLASLAKKISCILKPSFPFHREALR